MAHGGTLRIGVCGTGAFADSFIPLFQAHPLVGQVVLCDLDAEKLARKAAKFAIADTCPSPDRLGGFHPEHIAKPVWRFLTCGEYSRAWAESGVPVPGAGRSTSGPGRQQVGQASGPPGR